MRLKATPLLALLAIASAAACAQDRQAQWEFRASVPSTMQAQVLNPDAGSGRPVTGMDGPSAMLAAKRHEMMGEKKQSEGALESMVKAIGGKKE